MSGFPRPITAAQIAAAGGLLAANNLNDVANKATSRTNLAVLGIAANLSDVNSAATSRTNLGLGTAAVQNVGAFAQVANNLSDLSNVVTALINLNGVPRTVVINAQTGTTYTLVLADLGKLVTLTNGAGITLTVPTTANQAFGAGDEVLIAARGAGQVTVVGDTGVTVNGAPGLKLTDQYSYATLTRQTAANTWDLVGRLSA